MEQIVLQQQKLMRADKGIRFVFAQPKQLCQRKRAGDLRQAGGFVKCLVVQHTAQSLGLIFRAAVQPHQKGAKRLARTVRERERFALCGDAYGCGNTAGRLGQRVGKPGPRGGFVLRRVGLHAFALCAQGIFLHAARQKFQRGGEKASFHGGGAHVQHRDTAADGFVCLYLCAAHLLRLSVAAEYAHMMHRFVLDGLGDERHQFKCTNRFREMGVSGTGGCQVIVSENVDFGDASRNTGAEIVVRKPAAPMQHQRR